LDAEKKELEERAAERQKKLLAGEDIAETDWKKEQV